MIFQRGTDPPSGPRVDLYNTRSSLEASAGTCSTASPPDQCPQFESQLGHLSDSYALPVEWQFGQKTVRPELIAAWSGTVSAPQLGQFGAEEGRNIGVMTLAQSLQVKVGWASVVMLFRGSF